MALIGEENKVENYNTIEPEKQPSGRDIILSLYNQPTPKPAFDPTTPEYLKRAAVLNGLGRGLATLADINTLKRGGTVNPPTADTDTKSYINNYFKYLDDYKNKVDQYNLLDFRNKMSLGQALAGQANADRSFEESQNRRKEDVAYRENQANKTDERFNKQFDFAKQKYEEAPERQKDLYKFQTELQSQIQEAKRANALQDWITKESLKVQFDKEKGKYILYDDSGKPAASIDDEGQIQKLYDVITSDPKMKDEANAMMEVLKAELGEGVTMNHMKIIVSKLWDQSEQAKAFLGLSDNTSQEMVPQSNSNAPANSRQNVKQKWGSYAR